MTKLLTSVSAAVLCGMFVAVPAMAQTSPAPGGSMKLTQAQCTSVWNKLDAAKSGSVTMAAAQPHVTDFKAVDTNNDGKLSQTEFTAGCDRGLIHETASTGPGSGTAPKK